MMVSPLKLSSRMPGVLALLRVEVEEPATLDRLGVDRHADSVGCLEPEVPVEQAEVRLDAAGPQVEPHPDPVDGQVERAEVDVGAGGDLDSRTLVVAGRAADRNLALLESGTARTA